MLAALGLVAALLGVGPGSAALAREPVLVAAAPPAASPTPVPAGGRTSQSSVREATPVPATPTRRAELAPPLAQPTPAREPTRTGAVPAAKPAGSGLFDERLPTPIPARSGSGTLLDRPTVTPEPTTVGAPRAGAPVFGQAEKTATPKPNPALFPSGSPTPVGGLAASASTPAAITTAEARPAAAARPPAPPFSGTAVRRARPGAPSWPRYPAPIEASALDDFLRARGSAMAGAGEMLLDAGWRYNVDPRLIVAIAGAETSFGRHVCTSYNLWNWFWWDWCNSPFESWEQAIDEVARGLRTGYLDQGLTSVDLIAGKYCPLDDPRDTLGVNRNWPNNVSRYLRDLGASQCNLAWVQTSAVCAPVRAPAPGSLVAAAPAGIDLDDDELTEAELAGLRAATLTRATRIGVQPVRASDATAEIDLATPYEPSPDAVRLTEFTNLAMAALPISALEPRQAVPPPPPRSLREERLTAVRPSIAPIVATVVAIDAAPAAPLVPATEARAAPARSLTASQSLTASVADDGGTAQGLVVVLLVGLLLAGVGALRLVIPPGREPTGRDVVSWLGGVATRLGRRTPG